MKKRKFKLFTNKERSSFKVWWFTGSGNNQQIYHKKFNNREEAKNFIIANS
jgi:hypothetical protein